MGFSGAADFLNQIAFEVMPQKPKRVRTVKPGWVREMEQVHRRKDDEPV